MEQSRWLGLLDHRGRLGSVPASASIQSVVFGTKLHECHLLVIRQKVVVGYVDMWAKYDVSVQVPSCI